MKERFLTVMRGISGQAGPALARYKWAALTIVAFVIALVLSIGGAVLAVSAIERVVTHEARQVLDAQSHDWADISTDGLLVYLSGEAANEAERFRALSALSTVVAAERIIDDVTVTPAVDIAAPRFSLEILRNGVDISMIGLVPSSYDLAPVIRRIEAIDAEIAVVNMLETANHPVPFGWEAAVDFGVRALALVPVSKISIAADQVEVSGLADSERLRDQFRETLTRERPRGLITTVDITAPRPVISPFTLRFVIDDDGARFDACAADTPEARTEILRAARAAGAQGVLDCQIGLGSPSPRWQVGASAMIAALHRLGEGTVTLSDTDISLVVPNAVAAATFDQIVGELENDLPDVFSLRARRLPPTEAELESSAEALEFVASRSAEGAVLLRGRVTDERARDAITGMARAEFGITDVHMAARIDPDLPEGWALRALVAVDALAKMEFGVVRVRPDHIDIRGVSGNTLTSDEIARELGEQLGPDVVFDMNIRYDEKYDPIAQIPTPARCQEWIKDILAQQQITFDPGSARLVADAARVVDEIAAVLRECGRMEMEVGGHTDSQGSLEGNMRLSQQRAEAVIAALLGRGVLVSDLVAKGYGPEFPIADNATAEGREANRRIEFRLIGATAEAARADVDPDDTPTAAPPSEDDLVITVTTGAGETTRPEPRPQR